MIYPTLIPLLPNHRWCSVDRLRYYVVDDYGNYVSVFRKNIKALSVHVLQDAALGYRIFRNYYKCNHSFCDREWQMDWSAMCDDQCPTCGLKNNSPTRSEDVTDEYCE